MNSSKFWVKENQEGDISVYPSDKTLQKLTVLYKGKTLEYKNVVKNFKADNVIRRTEDDGTFSYLALTHIKNANRLLLGLSDWHKKQIQIVE